MCLALAETAIRDRLVLGEPGDRVCTEEWGGPEQATITGTFEGIDVDTDFHRANGCGIGDWALLDRILPAPA